LSRLNTRHDDFPRTSEILDELEASRSSRKRAWENLQELLGAPEFRWDEFPPPVKKTIDLEGRLIKDGLRKAILDRQNALHAEVPESERR
jgi:hypothetical protein